MAPPRTLGGTASRPPAPSGPPGPPKTPWFWHWTPPGLCVSRRRRRRSSSRAGPPSPSRGQTKPSSIGSKGVQTSRGSFGPLQWSISSRSRAPTETRPVPLAATAASVRRQVRQRSPAPESCEKTSSTEASSAWTAGGLEGGHGMSPSSRGGACGAHRQRQAHRVLSLRGSWSPSKGLSTVGLGALPRGQSRCCKSDE